MFHQIVTNAEAVHEALHHQDAEAQQDAAGDGAGCQCTLHGADFSFSYISTKFHTVFFGSAVFYLPEDLDKVAAIGEAALRADLAGLEPGGAKQLSGLFHPVLLDVLDGRWE